MKGAVTTLWGQGWNENNEGAPWRLCADRSGRSQCLPLPPCPWLTQEVLWDSLGPLAARFGRRGVSAPDAAEDRFRHQRPRLPQLPLPAPDRVGNVVDAAADNEGATLSVREAHGPAQSPPNQTQRVPAIPGGSRAYTSSPSPSGCTSIAMPRARPGNLPRCGHCGGSGLEGCAVGGGKEGHCEVLARSAERKVLARSAGISPRDPANLWDSRYPTT